VVALAEGRLRSLLEASLNAEGCDTRTVATLEDGEAAAEDLRLQGRPAAVVLDADATATPGLELLARLKLCHRPPPVLAILEADVPPVAQRTARERALRLGASHVVLVPGPAAAEADLAGAAGILAALLSAMTADVATEAGGAVAERIAMLAGEAAWTPLEGVTDPHGVTTAEAQEARLRARATALAGCHELADVALALVDAAAGYWPRAVLFVRSRGAWRALGAHGAGGDDGGLARSAHRLVFPLDAENLVSAAAAAGRVVERTDVSGGDAAVVAGLGRLRPTRLAALPVSPSAPAGSVLYLDDAGAPGDLPDLAPLARFAVTLSADLAAAVATADRRADARRARRTA
jgi:CheY-like chemotaxis protein